MSTIKFSKHPHAWRHPNWNRLQLRYFEEVCKIRREKNIEDFILMNGIQRVHVIKDNSILDEFFVNNRIQLVEADDADLVVITDQRFSRLSVNNMLTQLRNILNRCPKIYFCLNKYYLNANEGNVYPNLPEEYDPAIVRWLTDNLVDTVVLNRSEIFEEDGSCFTWVVPSCELLICKK